MVTEESAHLRYPLLKNRIKMRLYTCLLYVSYLRRDEKNIFPLATSAERCYSVRTSKRSFIYVGSDILTPLFMYKKISGRFINVLSRIIFFIIGVMSVFALLSALPYISGLRPLIVLSGSMEPVVHTGSLIFIDTNKKDADRGDIVTMNIRAGGEGEFLVTHRVLREEDGFLVTKGDANDSADGTRVRREDVVGTYVFQIPYLGYLIVFIRQRLRMPHVAMRLREVKI